MLGTTASYCCWLAGVAPGSVRVLVVNIGCQNRLLAIHASLLLSPQSSAEPTNYHHEHLARHWRPLAQIKKSTHLDPVKELKSIEK